MMPFGAPSARAMQLWDEIDQIVSGLSADMQSIIQELAKGAERNAPLVHSKMQSIQAKIGDYRHLLDKVAQGPDAPVDPAFRPKTSSQTTWQDLIGRAYALRGEFAQWPEVNTKIHAQLGFGSQSLYPNPDERSRLENQHLKTQDVIFDMLHRVINPHQQSQTAEDQNAHADIPLAQSTFVHHMLAALRLTRAQRLGRPARFLDVGCGGGLKVLSALQCFHPAEGLDLDADYVTAAKSLMSAAGQDPAAVFQANALTFDRYADYDVIYIFRPISDDEMLSQLEAHIVNTAHPGTILITPYSSCQERYLKLGCTQVAPALYLVKTPEAETTNLRRRAESMGVSTSLGPSGRSTIWAPLTHELAANGFG